MGQDVRGMPVYECLWCDSTVDDEGDTCNLVCYTNVFRAINMVTYLNVSDSAPKDIHLQPWAAALLATQEGTSEG